MIRLMCALAVTLAASACVGPRMFGAVPETPAWLEERIEEADASNRGYPSLSQAPPASATGSSQEEWERGVAEVQALRAGVLTDPILIDPDAAPGDDAVPVSAVVRGDAPQTVEE